MSPSSKTRGHLVVGSLQAPTVCSLQGAEILRHFDRIGPEHGKFDHLQRSGVRGGQHHWCRHTSLVGLRPAFGHDAPAIARSQTWEAIIRYRRDQVIADAALMIKKIRCHDRAHQVAGLSWSIAAAAVAIETGDRIATVLYPDGGESIIDLERVALITVDRPKRKPWSDTP